MGQAESTERLPIDEDNQRYAPFYVPERFTAEEQRLLAPFFSNLDRPVFVIYNLPEEVIGALSSRYSRSTKSLRRTFLDEYVLPLREGKATGGARKGDARASPSGVSDQGIWQNQLAEIVDVQRGRKFFDRWLAQYGDDSIAEMGGIHLCLEGISNIATVEVEDKRIGISPLEKSSRYVSFLDRRDDGEYRYVVPGELRGTPHERQYRQAMDSLFAAFAEISEPYLAYLYQKFPRGEDETEASFRGSRSAKRFDDLRDLLPFATQTNLALFGNGRAFEDLINRLLDHPIGELRWLGQAITSELERVVPSFIRRVRTRRGADVQIYRAGLRALREELANAALGADRPRARSDSWAELVSATPDADIEVLSAFVFGGAEGIPFDEVRRAVAAMTPEQRADLFQRVLAARDVNDPSAGRAEVRFRKVPRAFENARYLFALWARGGDYRDLHRHRLLTQERQRFTTRLGYDLEADVLSSPFAEKVRGALAAAEETFSALAALPDVAQYAVPFAYLQHWYANLTAREIYWIVELRTGPQGRPHYRQICQQIARQVMAASPTVFSGMRVDWSDYSLARRESEKRVHRKLEALSGETESSSRDLLPSP